MRWIGKRAGYIAMVAVCFVTGIVAGWTYFATRIDNYAYDELFVLFPPKPSPPQAVVLAIDARTLDQLGGMLRLRSIVADGLEAVRAAKPKAVAIDTIFADAQDPAEDRRLAEAMSQTHNLVLPCQIADRKWEDPLPEFKRWAAALGHVHRQKESSDGVVRQLPLEQETAGVRRWALALETYRLAQGKPIIESPYDLQVGDVLVPAARSVGSRALWIRYAEEGVPRISLLDLKENPALAKQLDGKVVFIGVTDLSAAGDRVVSPYGNVLPGVEVNAEAFETLADAKFLAPASDLTVLGLCLALALAAGLIFRFLAGWPAYAAGGALLAAAHTLPVFFFRDGIVFPYFSAISVAWLTTAGAASYQHFVVRRQLRRSETEKSRYQQAIHLGRARNAHAADGHSGIERADDPLRADRRQAQADEPR